MAIKYFHQTYFICFTLKYELVTIIFDVVEKNRRRTRTGCAI